MRLEWDPAKSESNLAERGFDFEFASIIFDGPTLERQDLRFDYGEVRIAAIGLAEGIHLTVVYTDRQDQDGLIRRIISARKSSRRERGIYDQQAG